MELNLEKEQRSPAVFTEEWLKGLSEHVKLNSTKFGTQKSYALSINLCQTYVSFAINGRFKDLSKSILSEIAYKTNYDVHNIRKVMESFPKRAVQYENDKVRERIEPSKPEPSETIQEEEVKKENGEFEDMKIQTTIERSHEVRLINKYLADKMILKQSLPKDLQGMMLHTLFNRLKKELNKVNEHELC